MIVKFDCARVISSLRSQVLYRSDIGPIIKEARGLTRLMNEWKCSQVKRDCNQVAKALALLARRCKYSAAWLGHAPMCVWSFLSADCNLSMPS